MFRRFVRGWLARLACLLWLIVVCHLAYLVLVAALSLYYRFAQPSVSMLMVVRSLFDRIPARPTVFLPIGTISPATRRAFIKLEDRGFYEHFGVSLGALREAYELNRKRGRIVAGGSTITMQLARNLFLWPERTFLRKYLEIGAALVLELVLDKERILELYLNLIEFGPGVYGLEAAARHHYDRPYNRLSRSQVHRLAAIITNPLRYDVRTMVRSPSQMARFRFLEGQ